MEKRAKIRINLSLQEFEIEGTEEFVSAYSEKIEQLFKERVSKEERPKHKVINSGTIAKSPQNPHFDPTMPETFGEYYHKLPKVAKDTDRILIAGHFAQSSTSENSFVTKNATSLLLDQGVKLSNSSVFIKLNINAKYIIQLAKGKYRVSKDGVNYIQELLSGGENSK